MGESHSGYLAVHDALQGTGGVAEWTSPMLPQSQGVRTVLHSDLTGDGHEDLIAITTGGVVYVHDVLMQTLVWQSPTLNNGRDVVIADLDGDGSRDIVAVTANAVYVYEHTTGPSTYEQTASYSVPQYSEYIRDALVFDADGDGELEVVALVHGPYGYEPTSRIVRLDQDLTLLGAVEIEWRAEMLVLEPSMAARKNVLAPTQSSSGWPTGIIAVDVLTGGEVWRSPTLVGQLAPNSLHFVTIGGERRMSFGTQFGMYLTR